VSGQQHPIALLLLWVVVQLAAAAVSETGAVCINQSQAI
jgi:hypothetical protein